jgi:hypothetical protein
MGDECFIGQGVTANSERPQATLRIGNRSKIASSVELDFTGTLIIGNDVVISSSVKIYTHDHGYEPNSVPTFYELIIEDKVWIGAGAYILPRVKRIGAGAVIGACAVVTKEVPRGAIIVGSPAKIMGIRPEFQ